MRFYGQFVNPRVDEYLFNTYFKDKKNGFFIECGASDGINENSCKFFEESLGWTGINIEPDSNNFRLLYMNRPNSLNINAALSDEPGEVEFTKVILNNLPDNGLNFIEKTNPHRLNMSEQQRETARYEKYLVKRITYSELLTNFIGNKSIDLFVLDVEGHEIQVLKSLKNTNNLPKVWCIEYTTVGLDTLKEVLNPLGYKFDSIIHNNAHFSK